MQLMTTKGQSQHSLHIKTPTNDEIMISKRSGLLEDSRNEWK